MQYEDSESEESSEEEYDQDDPLAVLYSYVRHYKSGTLAEPFLQLPSKREHPDYYLTIGDPISLNEVSSKSRVWGQIKRMTPNLINPPGIFYGKIYCICST